jgi:hypothetical protein
MLKHLSKEVGVVAFRVIACLIPDLPNTLCRRSLDIVGDILDPMLMTLSRLWLPASTILP